MLEPSVELRERIASKFPEQIAVDTENEIKFYSLLQFDLSLGFQYFRQVMHTVHHENGKMEVFFL